jgi:hypothetical protein
MNLISPLSHSILLRKPLGLSKYASSLDMTNILRSSPLKPPLINPYHHIFYPSSYQYLESKILVEPYSSVSGSKSVRIRNVIKEED